MKTVCFILAQTKNIMRRMNLHSKLSQNIRHINNKKIYSTDDIELFYKENEFMKDKKIITISPGGFKGFYMFGVCKYLKNNYDLSDYIFTGASAGSWNALMLCSKKDISEIESVIFDKGLLQNSKSIHELEMTMKNRLLQKYTTEDFDLNRLFIGVTTLKGCASDTTIFSGFENLEDAINCCIASSHIPLISGNLTTIYRNMLAFDGGFSSYPYLNTVESVLHITPAMWGRKNVTAAYQKDRMRVSDYTTLLSRRGFLFNDLIGSGYNDTKTNRQTLDDIFTPL